MSIQNYRVRPKDLPVDSPVLKKMTDMVYSSDKAADKKLKSDLPWGFQKNIMAPTLWRPDRVFWPSSMHHDKCTNRSPELSCTRRVEDFRTKLVISCDKHHTWLTHRRLVMFDADPPPSSARVVALSSLITKFTLLGGEGGAQRVYRTSIPALPMSVWSGCHAMSGQFRSSSEAHAEIRPYQLLVDESAVGLI